MWRRRGIPRLWVLLLSWAAASASAGESTMPTTEERPDHRESAERHEGDPPPLPPTPALPQGLTLDEVLDRASAPPPAHYPAPVPDDELRTFVLVEQLEQRFQDEGRDQLGWELQGWIGSDYDKIWWKSEGEAIFDGRDEGESETDLLYSRLITPFWNVQIGVQYANEWGEEGDSGRWSAVLALQGLAPGMVELDSSLYVSDEGDVTAEVEGEYNLRVTQRLVLQPRVELGFSFQDVSRRELGAGMTDAHLDLRVRYEIKRELAPYLGLRYRVLVGETRNQADRSGRDTGQLFFLAGLRMAF